MTETGRNVLYVLGSVGILYGLLCFIVHYLDFGWKLINGTWLHEKLPIIKKMRSGLFHRFLIFLVLAVIFYGGLRLFLGFIPDDWGRTDADGRFHSYRAPFISILAVAIAGITLYGFYLADARSEEELEKRQPN
ncbi:hypothetical protein GCM10027347_14790 [Larkinella harenae]